MSKPNTQLVVTGLGNFLAQPSPEAEAKKSELLQLSSLVLSVTSEEEQCDAVDAASELKALEAEVEKSRKLVKAPVLLAGEAIDTAAKKFAKEVTQERLRIEGLLTRYAIEVRKQAEMAAELQRAMEEEANEAERKRQAAEYAQEAKEAAALEQEIPPAPVFVPTFTPTPEAPKMEGARLKEEYDFEVTDIHALYAWNRLFVRLEVDRGNFKAYLNIPGTKVEGIPGVKIFKTAKTITRAAKDNGPRIIE